MPSEIETIFIIQQEQRRQDQLRENMRLGRELDEISDKKRLDWVLGNISGAEWRRVGIVYSAGCTRADIDKAMTKSR